MSRKLKLKHFRSDQSGRRLAAKAHRRFPVVFHGRFFVASSAPFDLTAFHLARQRKGRWIKEILNYTTYKSLGTGMGVASLGTDKPSQNIWIWDWAAPTQYTLFLGMRGGGSWNQSETVILPYQVSG
jgi:hypothetical protein